MTPSSQSLPLILSVTTEADTSQRPIISKIKRAKEIRTQQGPRLGKTSNQSSWMNKANRMTGWFLSSGLAGARTTWGWGSVTASEIPNEPCSMTLKARKDRGAQRCKRSQVGEQEAGPGDEY